MDRHHLRARRIALAAYWLPLVIALLAVVFIAAPGGFA